jgi:hypothetical protein
LNREKDAPVPRRRVLAEIAKHPVKRMEEFVRRNLASSLERGPAEAAYPPKK